MKEIFPDHVVDIVELLEEGCEADEITDIILEGRIPHILKTARQRVMNMDEFESGPVLHTSRSGLWNKAKIFYKRGLYNTNLVKKNLVISFEEEDGIDGGALRNEFFVSALKSMNKEFFEGTPGRRLPRCHWGCEVELKIGGVLVSHSLLLGGPGFPCLHPAVYQLVCGEAVDELAVTAEDLLPKTYPPMLQLLPWWN